ncbi:uncharacterized protein LOC106091716 [Stomoxys calcitrans]|uniref:Uncharacterized protein n=1 Tax=Stomoxys calcitrans TaxID=35570 RepID=A0A1I8PXM9_STOCA|nr:uncharacterized protein LOC106091716 [Stomoxys calcitrans]
MPVVVADDFDQFDAFISVEDPLEDYEKLLNEKLKIDAIVPNEMVHRIWDKISNATTAALWKIIFENEHETNEKLDKTAGFLRIFKDDACFYSPWKYNQWITKVRAELLRRGMVDFWKNVIVEKELGPAWARDCDLFDDTDDTEPAQFYNYAGCEAPWNSKT